MSKLVRFHSGSKMSVLMPLTAVAPPKVRGKRRVNETDAVEHAGDDFDVADVLGESVGVSLSAPSQSLADMSLKSPNATTMTLAAARRKATTKGDDTDTEDEEDSNRPHPSDLPTPGLSPPSKGRAAADLRPGRIIGNAFPLNDFRKNLERGDVVSKALKDMGTIIPEIVEESFSTQRYDEALQCMREMRDVALKVRPNSFLDAMLSPVS
jgi:ATP-dependent DNA helicase 2 subunit 2